MSYTIRWRSRGLGLTFGEPSGRPSLYRKCCSDHRDESSNGTLSRNHWLIGCEIKFPCKEHPTSFIMDFTPVSKDKLVITILVFHICRLNLF